MTAKTIMVMGTSSSVGKSLFVAALCRCFSRMGLRVAPFKSQNMSNNADVCADGGEIGRSTAMQAFAARVEPQTDMNPILMKPEAMGRSQVIVNGRPLEKLDTNDYFARRQQLWPHITGALDRLLATYDVVVIEGAGSVAELNLADVEMTNMSVARYCDAPVILLGDIDRGGIFAQLLGSLSLLPADDRARIRGLVINKFHGDQSLFETGIEIIEQRGATPVLGVMPFIDSLQLPDEDAVALDERKPTGLQDTSTQLDIAVMHFPHIANFDDFDPLAAEPGVSLRYVRSHNELGKPDVIVLPGTKSTIADLQWLRDTGIADGVRTLASLPEDAVAVVGICGGYQMLGEEIRNPDGIESEEAGVVGLGLLPITTTFSKQKQTTQSRFQVVNDAVAPGAMGEVLVGYEIHHGQTETNAGWLAREQTTKTTPASDAETAQAGTCTSDGNIWGCYLHGLFHNDAFRRAWLARFGINANKNASSAQTLDRELDRLADTVTANIDLPAIIEMTFQHKPLTADVADG
ncbi:MAG: cobyric acid synthase [bacterium]|nr:cobyric acid synthase [bacterium]